MSTTTWAVDKHEGATATKEHQHKPAPQRCDRKEHRAPNVGTGEGQARRIAGYLLTKDCGSW